MLDRPNTVRAIVLAALLLTSFVSGGLTCYSLERHTSVQNDAAVIMTPGAVHNCNPGEKAEFEEHCGQLLMICRTQRP